MAVEIPVHGFKLQDPQAFVPQASSNWVATICGQSFHFTLLNKHNYRRTEEPCTPTKATIIIGRWLISEQFHLEMKDKSIVEH